MARRLRYDLDHSRGLTPVFTELHVFLDLLKYDKANSKIKSDLKKPSGKEDGLFRRLVYDCYNSNKDFILKLVYDRCSRPKFISKLKGRIKQKGCSEAQADKVSKRIYRKLKFEFKDTSHPLKENIHPENKFVTTEKLNQILHELLVHFQDEVIELDGSYENQKEFEDKAYQWAYARTHHKGYARDIVSFVAQRSIMINRVLIELQK